MNDCHDHECRTVHKNADKIDGLVASYSGGQNHASHVSYPTDTRGSSVEKCNTLPRVPDNIYKLKLGIQYVNLSVSHNTRHIDSGTKE